MASSSEHSAPPTPPLARAGANDVLRYWLASLQLEEALSTRPRARRVPAGVAAPRLDAPAAGQEYFKVALDGELEALVCKKTALCKPLDAELGAFFEGWLLAQYRRGEEDRDLSQLLAFPVVHLPRGELAGLLRCGLKVRFGEPGAAPFKVPTRGERRRKEYPSAPSEVRLFGVERGARQWPFFIDTRLLHQQLGVARESIDGLFAELRKRSEIGERQMLSMVCEMLEAELREGAPPTAAAQGDPPADAPAGARLLERMTAAMARLLAKRGGRARVYPVGIVLDGTRAKATWHLQRELQALLEDRPEVAWELDSCLGSYLTGAPGPRGMTVQRTLFHGVDLSPSQRHAAERAGGSRLTAVSGPPGTGKTTLILHLAAEALVRQVDRLADHGSMGDGVLVVTSTNNRAVDNVVDALSAEGLPLALRAGSQKVCEHMLAPRLAQARAWLEAARQLPAAERAARLAAALEQFKQLRGQVDVSMAPRAQAYAAQTRRSELRSELERIEARAGERSAIDGVPEIAPTLVAGLHAPLEKARKRARRLCELAGEKPGLAQLTAVDRYYRKSAKRDLPELEQACADAGATFELDLPPDLPASTDPAALMEVWEAAAEAALAKIEALQERIASAADDARRRDRNTRIARELAALGEEVPGPASSNGDHDALQRELFAAAVAAREAWAAAESDALLEVVKVALEAAKGDRSLRALWTDDRTIWKQLRQLFGVWGCTLLSLGNCFPAQRDAIQRLIIDEAGQCHPTYAVSGLLRSRSALIIGDVHQLEPVIDLAPDDDERVIQSCKLTLSAAALAPYRVHSEARCSVQALADRAVVERPRLTDHFRCQPEIISICDALCEYGLRVHTSRQRSSPPVPFLQHPVSFIDLVGEQERLGGSWQNGAELNMTLELFLAIANAGIDPSDIAVITPYRGQLEQLRKQFVRMNIPLDPSIELFDLEDGTVPAGRGAALGTVHRFQGGERSIVLFSSVVTQRASLGFLDDRENLLNVAVSRARHHLIALGDRALLASGHRTSLLTRAAEPLEPGAFRSQLGLQLGS